MRMNGDVVDHQSIVQPIKKQKTLVTALMYPVVFLFVFTQGACSKPAEESSSDVRQQPEAVAKGDVENSASRVDREQGLRIVKQPLQCIAGRPMRPAPVIELRDEDGAIAAGRMIAATLGGGEFLAGSITKITTDEDGRAVFNNLIIDKAGAYRITFEEPGGEQAVSSEFSIRFGPPRNLVIVTQPGETDAGRQIDPAPQVLVTDNSGNPVPGITLEALEESHGADLFGAGRFAISNDDGLAVFDQLTPNKPVASARLVFKANAAGVRPVVSSAIPIRQIQ